MNFHELKEWLSQRMRKTGKGFAEVNFRMDEAPYERPVNWFKSASEQGRADFKQAVKSLVEEATSIPWDPEHFHQLCLLIEASELYEAERWLSEALAPGPTAEDARGLQIRMLTLRTLLSLGWKGPSPFFWRDQPALLRNSWPGIVFEGIAAHSIDMALDELPKLALRPDAMRNMTHIFPGLMNQHHLGLWDLRRKCEGIQSRLAPEVAVVLRGWFQLEGLPLERELASGTLRESLRRGLEKILPGESAPRATCASLSPEGIQSSMA